MWFPGPQTGLFCPLDAIANSNPIHARKRIRLTHELQSDGSCRVNRMRRRVSIRCAFAFQSIETFFAFPARRSVLEARPIPRRSAP